VHNILPIRKKNHTVAILNKIKFDVSKSISACQDKNTGIPRSFPDATKSDGISLDANPRKRENG
jgi:hypothetical protein